MLKVIIEKHFLHSKSNVQFFTAQDVRNMERIRPFVNYWVSIFDKKLKAMLFPQNRVSYQKLVESIRDNMLFSNLETYYLLRAIADFKFLNTEKSSRIERNLRRFAGKLQVLDDD